MVLGSLVGLLSPTCPDRHGQPLRPKEWILHSRSTISPHGIRLFWPLGSPRHTVASQLVTAASGPHLSRRTDPRSSNSCRRKRKGTSPPTLVSFSERISVTTAEYTDIPELDPMHWSFSQRPAMSDSGKVYGVASQTCVYWLDYLLHHDAREGLLVSPSWLDEPNYVTYLVYGRTYHPGSCILPTDQVSDIACQGEWFEYKPNQPSQPHGHHFLQRTKSTNCQPGRGRWVRLLIRTYNGLFPVPMGRRTLAMQRGLYLPLEYHRAWLLPGRRCQGVPRPSACTQMCPTPTGLPDSHQRLGHCQLLRLEEKIQNSTQPYRWANVGPGSNRHQHREHVPLPHPGDGWERAAC